MPARRQRLRCPACGGRKRTEQFLTREEQDADPERRATAIRACPKCDGRGYLLKPLTVEQRLKAAEQEIKRLRKRVKMLEEGVPRFWNTGPNLHIALGDQVKVLPIEPQKSPALEPREHGIGGDDL